MSMVESKTQAKRPVKGVQGIRLRETAAGVRYDVRLRVGDAERSKTFRTRKDAEAWRRQQLSAVDEGSWIDPQSGRVTLASWSNDWLDSAVNLRATTRAIHRRNLDLHILPALGSVELGKLKAPSLRAWLNDLAATPLRSGKPRSAGTTRQAYGTLERVLSAAVKDGVLARNPLDPVDQPKADEREMKVLDVDQLATVLDDMNERYRVLVLVAAYCGLRAGELVGLRRKRVDLVRRRITVEEQITEISGGELVTGPPKTKAGRREVPIPSFVADQLVTHMATWSEPGPNGLVFTSPGGGPIRWRSWVGRYWRPVVDPLGHKDLRFHDMRHTFASLAIASGADIKTLQRILGHASAAMTLDRYGKMYPDSLDQVADKLDIAGRKARGTPPADIIELPKQAVPK
jgi:integrase